MVPARPGDFEGLHVQRIAKLTAIDMTTAAVFNVYNNGPNTVMLVAIALTNFSSFPDNTALPATWAFTYGSAPTTATPPTSPTNLRSAQTVSGAVAPYLLGTGITTTSPYLPPFYTLYFAISTATNGAGTFNVNFFGGFLAKN